ncbi:MAG TPA: SDR family NAD(P)-dependent oxidoreductase [Opitutaceae bacterium]|nr:SDR family NAD(P)-dependent oxidoreductase [Opitutaceae bacterium]
MPILQNATVIVTGASSGIGEATVRRLFHAGANVVLFARRAERMAKLVAEIEGESVPGRQRVATEQLHAAPTETRDGIGQNYSPGGKSGRTLVVEGDITQEADRRRLVSETLARFGRIDGLINNAGYGQRGPIERVPLDAIRRNFETNVFGLLGLTQLVAPTMRQQRAGRIINISSVAGKIARPMSSIYDATKHAIEAFSDGLRGELKPFGVQLVVIRPGYIVTEFIDAANKASIDLAENPGPYAPYVETFRGGARKLRKLAGQPDDVARAIERALTAAYPKPHYVVPGHAKLFLFAKWILPTRLMDHIVRLRSDVR